MKWYMNKVCYMYRFMFVMCPICYRTDMFYNTSTFYLRTFFSTLVCPMREVTLYVLFLFLLNLKGK